MTKRKYEITDGRKWNMALGEWDTNLPVYKPKRVLIKREKEGE